MKVLRDNWLIFSIVALVLCGLTIVVPQVRLMAASLTEEGGRLLFCIIKTACNSSRK